MITANEARALVEKYNEEMAEIVRNAAKNFVEIASDRIISAASKGLKDITIEVPNSKVRQLFIDKMTELGFKADTYERITIVKVTW